MAYILKVTGEKVPLNGKPTVEQLREAVGGWLEIVRTDDGQYMVLNEEGKLMNLPLNRRATEMVRGTLLDIIVGNVVICGQGEID